MKLVKEGPFLFLKADWLGCWFWVMVVLVLDALLFSLVYDWAFFPRFAAFIALAFFLEGAFFFLSEGRFALKSGSSAISGALLILSVPSSMNFLHLVYGLIFALWVVRFNSKVGGLSLNPMLMGRLFLMMAFNVEMVAWSGGEMDALTAATPLELFYGEGEAMRWMQLLWGTIGGVWEDLYVYVPGSPGDLFPLFLMASGLFLALRGVVSLLMGGCFLFSFVCFSWVMGEPVLFHLLSGSVLFSAIFIAGDPKSTPASKGGRIVGGLLAGLINGWFRKYTFYSEGIVFSFLIVNVLASRLDALAFWFRAWRIEVKRKLFIRSFMS